MTQKQMDIALGIVIWQDQVLVGWRKEGQHQAHHYEFAGGKCEKNERPILACRREIYEETGLDLDNWRCIANFSHQYDDLNLNFHVYQSYIENDVKPNLISDVWKWYSRGELLALKFPAANQRIIEYLYWPKIIKISACLDVPQSPNLIYFRPDEQLSVQQSLVQVQNFLTIHPREVKQLILNYDLWQRLTPDDRDKINTIHLKHSQLASLTADQLIAHKRYIAACHDAHSIAHARALGCDAVFISPVHQSATHPEQVGMGWSSFKTLAKKSPLLSFALGGLVRDDLTTAEQHGAYGISGIRNF